MESRRLGNIYGEDKGTGFAGNVWDVNAMCPTLTTMQGGGREPMVVEVGTTHWPHGWLEADADFSGVAPTIDGGISMQHTMLIEKELTIVAMRGRDPQNPSDRTPGNPNLEQTLEPNAEGICNTITTVQKDNMVLVKQATKDGYIPCNIGGVADLSYPTSQTRRGRVIDQGNVSPTLTTENTPSVLEKWTWEIDGQTYLIRIRKLTPNECWRLMDFSDEDFHKAEAVNSNTQLYKQAGNSIVRNVLCEVFKQLI